MHVRTVAAVIAWAVVALLLMNSFFRSDWILLIAIILTAIAFLFYFSPRLIKNKQSDGQENEAAST